jgi:DNA-3-methyladenine glycosylase
MTKLPLSFFQSDDVVSLAKSLLGKYLLTNFNGILTGGMITETEAYEGITDRASHAYNGLRTNRTEVMYHPGGTSYVYLCYGIHSLFNIVTNQKDIPHAILIRGVYPIVGVEEMLKRTGKSKIGYHLTNGPGKLTKALGITMAANGLLLDGNKIWIENKGTECDNRIIKSGSRIGVDYAGEDALLPYRFVLDYSVLI